MEELLLGYCFFCNDTATTEIYTLSLHDALPISRGPPAFWRCQAGTSAEQSSALSSGERFDHAARLSKRRQSPVNNLGKGELKIRAISRRTQSRGPVRLRAAVATRRGQRA